MTKLKAFADNKYAVAKMAISLCDRVKNMVGKEEDASFENIVGKGENAGHQHFLLFPQCFLPNQKQKSLF